MGNLVKHSVLIPILMQGLPVLAAQRETFTVVRVIDGDTCIIENGERVRYLGTNAPEEGDAQFNEATQANHDLVAGKEVRFEPEDPSRNRGGRLRTSPSEPIYQAIKAPPTRLIFPITSQKS